MRQKILMLLATVLLTSVCAMAQSNDATLLKGDVNGDGTVDVADIVAVIDLMAKGEFSITWNGNGATSFSSTNATTSFTENVAFSSLTKPAASRKYTYTFGSTPRTYTYVHDDATDWGESTTGAKFSGILELKNYTFYALWGAGSWDNNSIPSAGSDVTRTITWNLNNGSGEINGATTQYTVQYAWSPTISSLPVKPAENKTFTSTSSIVESLFTFPSNPTAPSDSQEFDGWYTTENGGTKITADNIKANLSKTGNTTFYAHYKAKAVTYYFSVGTEEVTSSNYTTANNATTTIPTTKEFTNNSGGKASVYVLAPSNKTVTIKDTNMNIAFSDVYEDTSITIPNHKVWTKTSKVGNGGSITVVLN